MIRIIHSTLSPADVDPADRSAYEAAVAAGQVLRRSETEDRGLDAPGSHARLVEFIDPTDGTQRYALDWADIANAGCEDSAARAQADAAYERHVRDLADAGWPWETTDVERATVRISVDTTAAEAKLADIQEQIAQLLVEDVITMAAIEAAGIDITLVDVLADPRDDEATGEWQGSAPYSPLPPRYAACVGAARVFFGPADEGGWFSRLDALDDEGWTSESDPDWYADLGDLLASVRTWTERAVGR